jgi:ribonuclease HI
VLTEAKARDLKVIVKWVKGHQGTGTTPGYLNTQVDRMAREGRISRERTIKSTPIRS